MLLAGEMLKSEKPTLNIVPSGSVCLGGLCASGWGNVKNFFENVLLAGEMIKSEKPTFNISPVGALFWGVVCFWLGKCYFFLKIRCSVSGGVDGGWWMGIASSSHSLPPAPTPPPHKDSKTLVPKPLLKKCVSFRGNVEYVEVSGAC